MGDAQTHEIPIQQTLVLCLTCCGTGGVTRTWPCPACGGSGTRFPQSVSGPMDARACECWEEP